MTRFVKAISLVAAAFALTFSPPANAGHPRRHQVNSRLRRQNRRIHEGVKSGRLDRQQANQLHAEHQAIRAQERADASRHGGHITRHERRQLNREENAESRQIYNEKH